MTIEMALFYGEKRDDVFGYVTEDIVIYQDKEKGEIISSIITDNGEKYFEKFPKDDLEKVVKDYEKAGFDMYPA